jgi:hypothetical protein
MEKITDSKLDDASAIELARIASIATDRCGMSPPSAMEHYTLAIQQFIKVKPASSQGQQEQQESAPMPLRSTPLIRQSCLNRRRETSLRARGSAFD